MSKDLKTTLTAVVTGVVSILSGFGIIIPDTYLPAIVAVGVVVLGLLAKDSK